MSGQELYEEYAHLQLSQARCEVDAWSDLGTVEQDIWDLLASVAANA